MIALRLAVTLVLSALIAQAGWAAAYLGGDTAYLRHHSIGAWVALTLTLATAVLYLVLRRQAGPVNVTLAIGLAIAVTGQLALGQSHARGPHIFVGVLVMMLATALTSWTYRHTPQPAADPAAPELNTD